MHARTPRKLLDDIGWKAFLGFHILVGGMILSSLLHTVFLGTLLGRVVFEGLGGLAPRDIWDWFALLILATGYGGAWAVVFSGLGHLRAWRLMPVQLIVPLYWMLHSIATLFAAVELITKPMHWAKTTHGKTRLARRGARPAGAEELRPRTG